jgi:hypothetical protein
LGSRISKTLVALAASGITDRQELRSKALRTIPQTRRESPAAGIAAEWRREDLRGSAARDDADTGLLS